MPTHEHRPEQEPIDLFSSASAVREESSEEEATFDDQGAGARANDASAPPSDDPSSSNDLPPPKAEDITRSLGHFAEDDSATNATTSATTEKPASAFDPAGNPKTLIRRAKLAAAKEFKTEVEKLRSTKRWATLSDTEKKAAQRRLLFDLQNRNIRQARNQARDEKKRARKALKKNPHDTAAQATHAKAAKTDKAAVELVAGRLPINHALAGESFPDEKLPAKYRTAAGGAGVKFTKDGFPDFKPHAKALPNGNKTFPIKPTGDRDKDFAAANAHFGFTKAPEGFTWHHVENGTSLMLVPDDLHDVVKHTGGVAMEKHRTGRDE